MYVKSFQFFVIVLIKIFKKTRAFEAKYMYLRFFIMVKYMEHEILPFQPFCMDSSMRLIIHFSVNICHYSFPETFSSFQTETLYPLKDYFFCSSTHLLATTILVSDFINLTIVDTSYNWSHTTFVSFSSMYHL